MRRRAGLAVAALIAVLAGGCGIPDNTEVRPLRPGPSTGASTGVDGAPARVGREDTNDPGQFVTNYLTLAAGDFDGAAERAKAYMSQTAAATFRPQTDLIKVVRPVEEDPLFNPGSAKVEVRAREVGTLRQKGLFEPSADDRILKYEFEVGTAAGKNGLFITKAPPVLLLSDTALGRYYTERTIYFWNQDHTGLIPDLRYLPESVPDEQQPTQIIDWLTSGPAPWLAGVAEAWPEGTKSIGNVPAISNQTLQISLSGQALPADDQVGALDRLQKQLRWSLRPNLPGTLELIIEHSVDQRYTGTDYLTANPSYRQIAEPERFVVYRGQIKRLSGSYNSSQPVPIVRPEDNKNIEMAALGVSGGRAYAALVTTGPGGRVLRVGATGAGEFATLRTIRLAEPIGRPVWAKSAVGADDGTSGLITSAGKLFGFSANRNAISEVQWPGGRPGPITGVSVAPDAHRVAILAGGQLYVAALSRSDDGVQISSPHVVRTELTALTAVDWTSETVLVLAGTRKDVPRVAIREVSIDGSTQTPRLDDLGENPVTYLTAMPASPTKVPESAGAVAYVQNGAAYDDRDTARIGVQDLTEAVTDPPPDALPGAPFFLY